MELKSNEFWTLHEGTSKFIYDQFSDAITRMKKGLQQGTDLELFRIFFEEDKMKIEQVPWKEIAIAMSGGE